MKRIYLISLVLLYSLGSYSSEFYVYHTTALPFSANPIYTQSEYKAMAKLGIHYQVSRFESEKSLAELARAYPEFIIEPVQNIELYSYRDYQWHLENKGGDILRWITDIDTEIIPSTAGEDIQNFDDRNLQFKNIKVAIIDSGIDLEHPDLKDVIINKPKECEALTAYRVCLNDRNQENQYCHQQFAQVDTDQNGYPLDCQGWSVTNKAYPGVDVAGNPEVIDQIGHGTHIAGIIGAQKNDFGVDGIADNVTLIPVQVAMSSNQNAPIDNIAKGVLYAIKNKADIINLSLGWKLQFDSKLMRDMVQAAIQKNIAVVVAAGNNSHSDISYPCAYQGVICVAAHDQTGSLSDFSNRGSSVDIIAPGTKILSTWPTHLRSKLFTQDYNYEYLSGTSQAAPMVSGVLAKLMSRGLTAQQARLKIYLAARPKKQKADIRFGNLDYKNAVDSNAKQLLYPMNKEPLLLVYQIGNKNKLRIKLINMGEPQKNVPLTIKSLSKDIKVSQTHHVIDSIDTNEQLEIDIPLDIISYRESEHRFRLEVNQRQFTLRANIVRIIKPDSNDTDLVAWDIIQKLDKNTTLKVFEDYTPAASQTDFIGISKSSNATTITILQQHQNQYQSSSSITLRDPNPIFLNFSKIDIDKDLKADYVITYVITQRDGSKVTKFLIIDSHLKIKRYLIAPKNKFDNQKTFMPGRFKWISMGQKFVPAWVGIGENGSQIPQSPWEPNSSNIDNYLYYLDSEKGLQHLSFPKGHTPLHILYQSQAQLEAGTFFILTSSGVGFFKHYQIFHYDHQLKLMDRISLDGYFDLYGPRPLPLNGDLSGAFFHESAPGGAQNIMVIQRDNSVESELISLDNPFKNENIKFIQAITKDIIFYQTEYKIVAFNRQTKTYSYRESKVDTRRRRYQVIPNQQRLFLPAAESPNYTSEVLAVNSSQALSSLGQYRILALKGCEEIGLISQREQSFIAYSCVEAKKILFLPLH